MQEIQLIILRFMRFLLVALFPVLVMLVSRRSMSDPAHCAVGDGCAGVPGVGCLLTSRRAIWLR